MTHADLMDLSDLPRHGEIQIWAKGGKYGASAVYLVPEGQGIMIEVDADAEESLALADCRLYGVAGGWTAADVADDVWPLDLDGLTHVATWDPSKAEELRLHVTYDNLPGAAQDYLREGLKGWALADTDDGSSGEEEVYLVAEGWRTLEQAVEHYTGTFRAVSDDSRTHWVSWTARPLGEDWTEAEEGLAVLAPTEPECDSVEGHDWRIVRAPRGHGGGVRYAEGCRVCGLVREVDTWASHGAIQGLDSVAFLRPRDDEYDYDFPYGDATTEEEE